MQEPSGGGSRKEDEDEEEEPLPETEIQQTTNDPGTVALDEKLVSNLNETSTNSCDTSTTSVSSNASSTSSIVNATRAEAKSSSSKSPTDSLEENSKPASTTTVTTATRHDEIEESEELYDKFDKDRLFTKTNSTTTIKRTHLVNLIYELYDLNENKPETAENDDDSVKEESESGSKLKTSPSTSIVVESYMEKLPPGKNLKNSILLAWKRRYFKLNSLGVLYVHDIDDKTGVYKSWPDEVYNIMGGRVDYEQNKIVSLDDCRGNYLVFRCIPEVTSSSSSSGNDGSSDELFQKWRTAIDTQIIDRSHSLWVRPNQPLNSNEPPNKPSAKEKVFA
jgi:hypothetical protein